VLGPILRGTLIDLEPGQAEDVPLRRRWLAELEVSRLLGPPGVLSLRQEEEKFERDARAEDRFLWRIVLDGAFIGQANLHDIEWQHRQTRQGTWIGDRAHWGKGYATEVVRLRTAFALGEVGLERIETSSMAANIGMHRALERSGFRRIGLRTRMCYFEGAWHDEYIFELLREEWLERQT
jgi:[ribosomal protein S5]-alanine N-acetyltransferase